MRSCNVSKHPPFRHIHTTLAAKMQAKCPACSRLLNFPDHLAGKPVKCQCGKVFKCSAPKKRPVVTQPAKRPAARKSFRITCPKCNKALNVEEKLLGQMVKCPCGTKIQTKPSASSSLSPLAQSIADNGAEIWKSQLAARRKQQEEEKQAAKEEEQKKLREAEEEEETKKFWEDYNERGRRREENSWFLKIGMILAIGGLVAFGSFAGTQYLESSYNDYYSTLPETESEAGPRAGPGFSSKEDADIFFGSLCAGLFGIVVIGGTLWLCFANPVRGGRAYRGFDTDGDGENDFFVGGDF